MVTRKKKADSSKEGDKTEKYKCFLSGKYKGKKVVILPSFSGINEGIDAREMEKEMVWKFHLQNFEVWIVSDNLSVLNFGKLKKLDRF